MQRNFICNFTIHDQIQDYIMMLKNHLTEDIYIERSKFNNLNHERVIKETDKGINFMTSQIFKDDGEGRYSSN